MVGFEVVGWLVGNIVGMELVGDTVGVELVGERVGTWVGVE